MVTMSPVVDFPVAWKLGLTPTMARTKINAACHNGCCCETVIYPVPPDLFKLDPSPRPVGQRAADLRQKGIPVPVR